MVFKYDFKKLVAEIPPVYFKVYNHLISPGLTISTEIWKTTNMCNKLNFKNLCVCVFMSVYGMNVGSYAFIQMPCTHKNAEAR